MNTFKTTRIAALCLLTATGAGTALQAAAGNTAAGAVAAEYVRVADLDLGSEHGVRVLARRIDAAAARVCALPNLKSVGQRARFDDCTAGARERALTQAASLARVDVRDLHAALAR